jgi:hypothetical protein
MPRGRQDARCNAGEPARLADWKPGGGSCRPRLNIRKSGGGYVVFEHPDVAEAVSVPARRPIKPVYVRRFVAFIEAVRASNE